MTRHYYITPEDYAAAAERGICASTLESRVRELGWDVERAINTPPPARRSYPELRELAKQNGVSSGTFYDRIRRGWDPELAAMTPLLSNQQAHERLWGSRRKIPREIKDLAMANGICLSTFYGRIRDCGWTPERAATEPVWTQEQASAYGNARLRELHGAVLLSSRTPG